MRNMSCVRIVLIINGVMQYSNFVDFRVEPLSSLAFISSKLSHPIFSLSCEAVGGSIYSTRQGASY